jgi:hypothetical protein
MLSQAWLRERVLTWGAKASGFSVPGSHGCLARAMRYACKINDGLGGRHWPTLASMDMEAVLVLASRNDGRLYVSKSPPTRKAGSL